MPWLVLCIACVALLAWRRPGVVTAPQLWAEDGPVFFLDAWRCGPAALWYHYSGYLHLFPRLVAWGARLAPLAWTPHLYAWSFVIPIALVAHQVSSKRLTAPPWTRVAMMVPLGLPPLGADMTFSPSYAHWVLVLAMPLTLVSARPRTLGEAAGDAGRLTLTSASSPTAIIFAPLLAMRLARDARHWYSWLSLVPPCAMAAVQLWFVATSGRLTVHRPGPLPDLASYAMLRTVLGESLGTWWTAHLPGSVSLTLLVLAMGGLAWASLYVGRRNAALFAGAGLLVWVATLVSVRAHPDVIVASRYQFLPVTLAIWAALQLVASRRATAAVCLLVPLLNAGAWRQSPPPRVDWSTVSACVPRGGPCVVPIQPEGWKIDMQELVGREAVVCGHRD